MGIVKLPYAVVEYRRMPDGELRFVEIIEWFNDEEPANKLWKDLSFKAIDNCEVMYKIKVNF